MLALVNQGLLFRHSEPAPLSVRLAHRAFDAGQLLTAGFASWALFELVERFAVRRGSPRVVRWARPLVVGGVVFIVSLLVVSPDVTNVAARYHLPLWLVSSCAASSFGLLLGATSRLPRLLGRARLLLLPVGVACAAGNAFVLLNDYPAAHLILAWFAALLIAAALEGTLTLPRLPTLARRVLVGVVAALSLATVLVRPSQSVLKRLYGLPSAVLAPFVARFYPDHAGPNLALVRREFLASPWFRSREKLPPVPASRALPEVKSVLLLTVDALRADLMSDSSPYLKELPTFAALRKKCAYFSQARSTASSTRAAFSTVFVGHYLSQFYASMQAMRYEGPRLPVLVSQAGVKTVSIPRYSRITVAAGVTIGFETELWGRFDAGGIVDRLIESFDGSKPTFLFAHFVEPHAPYKGKGGPFQRYVQEVQRVDAQLGRFFEHLQERGLHRHSLVIVSSDHGEAFGEHGAKFHQRVIYEEVARVPLFICGPGVVAREIEEPVSLIDFAPTVLDAFALPTPGVFMGQSLLPLASGKNEKLRRPRAIHATHGLAGFYFDDGKKVIFDATGKTVEVYDLLTDPEERLNLSDKPDPSVRSAIETARLFFHQQRVARERKYPEEEGTAVAEGGMEAIDE
jgi:hypothetical protein